MAEVTTIQIAVIFLAAVLTNNIVLTNFLGLCSYFSLSGTMRTAAMMGISVMVITFISTLINFAIYRVILLPGGSLAEADLTFLTFLIFILVIAGLVQVLEALLERFLPELAGQFGPFLALITVNCAIMGVNLLVIEPMMNYNLLQVVSFSLGSGVGWLLVICIMAAIRTRLERADLPESLKGMGINLLVTGIMAMIFMGFTGMIDL
jgi:Na+-transporting NADH:ubiquinone oxidoreductase subunit E